MEAIQASSMPIKDLPRKLRSWSLPRPQIHLLLVLTLFFNLTDAVVTLALVSANLATEANPIMAFFLEMGPMHFMFAKITLVSLGVGVLWYFRRYQLAFLGAVSVFGIYSLLLTYHTRSIIVLLHHAFA